MYTFFSDLDNTLIYSYKQLKDKNICVEVKDNKELSFITPTALSHLKDIIKKNNFIPVTTRSVEQYKRVKIFKEHFPEYAITTNGATLLINNEIDQDFKKESDEIVFDSYHEIEKALKILNQGVDDDDDIRFVDNTFIFVKGNVSPEKIDTLKNELNLDKVDIIKPFQKIYIIPKHINKGNAINRLKKRFKKQIKNDLTVSAGDCILDVPMFRATDFAIAPINGLQSYVHEENILWGDSESFCDFVTKSVKHIINTKLNKPN